MAQIWKVGLLWILGVVVATLILQNTPLVQFGTATDRIIHLKGRRLDHSKAAIQEVNKQQIFFNRVPKCASELTRKVIDFLADRNGFKFHKASQYLNYAIDDRQQRDLVRMIEEFDEPMVFERHVHFINFTRFGEAMPVYINQVRDPLERLVSWYYFIRFQPGHERNMTEERRSRTYDDCVSKRLPECTNSDSYYKLIPYFCGQADFCRKPSLRSLNQAKKNVEKYYSVVGISEDLYGFFYNLEKVLPSFFTGATAIFQKIEEASLERYGNKKKKMILPATKTTMRRKLKYDYQFFYFIKQRFYSQMLSLSTTLVPPLKTSGSLS